jgi:hypothetical protein
VDPELGGGQAGIAGAAEGGDEGGVLERLAGGEAVHGGGFFSNRFVPLMFSNPAPFCKSARRRDEAAPARAPISAHADAGAICSRL